MIHSLVTVGVVHGKMNEYTEFVAKEFMPIYQRLGIKMIGSWRASIGSNMDECLVLFAWESMAQMEKLQDARNKDKEWQRVYPGYQALTTGGSTRLLQPNAYSTLK
jgi:hypothetical protein